MEELWLVVLRPLSDRLTAHTHTRAQLFHEALEQSRTELRSKGIDESTWPDALRPPAARAAADATDPDADDSTRRAYQEVDEEIKDLDIYLRTCVVSPRVSIHAEHAS